ncbi:XRE family transcriptional regulator [Bacillus pumilus]|uniref:XRE family transcriptional regulator n=1 Tax=Bacillus pumilus TaxID=1408 RepID=UPI001B39FCB3|nr:XRE family transcriptional regulator [Bacillus pumilus]MBQ4817621.1 XRE family transcriptional regulator [Bacillus pumilus]
MVDFSPLFETLKEQGKSKSYLRNFMSSSTQAKITKEPAMNGANLEFRVLEKICLELDVPIEKVVRILPDPPE